MRLGSLPPLRGSTAVASAVTPSRLDGLIPGRATPHGPLHERSWTGPWRGVRRQSVEALALSDGSLDLERPLFFDTETTGLHGGTGTVAFLLGLVRCEAGVATYRQLHLPGPGHERAMLLCLHDELERASVIVSFNGKSFDWPLLKSRFVMNRLPPPPELPHVDLLHCARRVFRHQLTEVRLAALERRVLDVQRLGDIEGALIPQAWFDYLRTGRLAVLGKVLEHNAQDLRSMVALIDRLCSAWEERASVLPPTALALAALALRRDEHALALRFCDRAMEGRWLPLALELTAEVERRRGAWDKAAHCLERAAQSDAVLAERKGLLHLSLAKLYEHRLKDFALARAHAERCADAETVEANEARVRRLRRREAARDTGAPHL